MAMDVSLPERETAGLTGRGNRFGQAPLRRLGARGFLLPFIAIVGASTWGMLSLASESAGQPVPASPSAMSSAQNTSWFNPAITPTQVTLPDTTQVAPPEETAPVEPSPLDGLKISSQSWRRGGLGSKALVTFTLRNGNDYAVRDIEISCAFVRRDGSHLTDRKRTIHDAVGMKSQRTFARLHVGFVNVNADKAKCSLLSASRL
jgi:hypothetical protein